MEILIRRADLGDGEAIWRINREALGYDFPLDQTIKRLALIVQSPTYYLAVAQLDQQVVGYIHCADYDCTYNHSLKNILAIAVDSSYQGKGIGRMLLEAGEEWARQDGAQGVRLVSGENRPEAHKFYRSCGYRLRKTQQNFIKQWDR